MNRTRHALIAFCILISLFGIQAQAETDKRLSVSNDSTHVKFQNHFYEALKQKALENYSKAIDELVI